jgi:hypothetical protein
MAAKLTRLTHKIAIQLHLVAESCTICSSRSRWPVWKLLDTTSYIRQRYKEGGRMNNTKWMKNVTQRAIIKRITNAEFTDNFRILFETIKHMPHHESSVSFRFNSYKA